MIPNWISKIFGILQHNKLFQSKTVNVILIIMAIFYSSMVWKSVIENTQGIGQPPLQPINISDIKLLDTNVSKEEALFVILNGTINFRHCNSYVLGSIISAETNVVLLDKITVIPLDVLDEAIDKHTPIKLNVGHLPKGKYLFRAEFHEICSTKSYIVLAPLVAFEVK